MRLRTLLGRVALMLGGLLVGLALAELALRLWAPGSPLFGAPQDVEWLGGKIVNLRLFADESGVIKRSLLETGGGILLISQFTLFASTKKGTAPSWHRAAKPEKAIPLYEAMITRLGELCGRPIATGRFGAMMQVALVNDGPVTLWLDSRTRE